MARSTEDRGLFIEERGAGSPVVLIHGMPSAPGDFEPLVARLAREHRVLVPHLPGYGRSPADPEPRPREALVARLELRLADAGITRADFVAFSAGAYLAVALALGGRIAASLLALFAPVVGLDRAVADSYRGTADHAVPAAWAEDLAKRVPRAVLERIEGAGHALFIEAPEQATRLVAEFLAATPAAGDAARSG